MAYLPDRVVSSGVPFVVFLCLRHFGVLTIVL